MNEFIKSHSIWLKCAIHLAAISPLIWLYYAAFGDMLGADPVKYVIHFTGVGALNVLIITLLISPLSKHLKINSLLKFRRLVGLYAFTYASLHLANFLAFDLQFNFTLFVSEVIKRPYITVGMLAYLIIFLLAITSINSIKRKMGKQWQSLHNFIYVISLLGTIHFYWSVKSEIIEPSLYIITAVFLLSLRQKKIRKWLKVA